MTGLFESEDQKINVGDNFLIVKSRRRRPYLRTSILADLGGPDLYPIRSFGQTKESNITFPSRNILLARMADSIHPYQRLNIDERVKRVLGTTPLFDGHNDLPLLPRTYFHGKINDNPKFNLRSGFQRGMTDIPRLREGAVGAQFWSIFVPCLRSAEDFAAWDYNDMLRDALEQVDLTHRLINLYPDVFELVQEARDVDAVYRKGKIACALGLEGLHMVGNSIAIIRDFYKLGIRYVRVRACKDLTDSEISDTVYAHSCDKQRLCRLLYIESRRDPWRTLVIGPSGDQGNEQAWYVRKLYANHVD